MDGDAGGRRGEALRVRMQIAARPLVNRSGCRRTWLGGKAALVRRLARASGGHSDGACPRAAPVVSPAAPRRRSPTAAADQEETGVRGVKGRIGRAPMI